MGAFPASAGAFIPPPASPPVNTSPPTIAAPAGQSPTEVSSPQEGRILVSTPGTWTGTPKPGYTYQWAHCDTSTATLIPGASNRTYEITSGDLWHTLCVVVTAKNKAGTTLASSAQTGVVGPGSPIDRSAPAISGLAQVGQTLTVSPGTWNGTAPITYAYQWRRCDSDGLGCFAIHGATSSSYVLGTSDLGRTLRVEVTAVNQVGSVMTNSRPSPVVAPGKSPAPVTVSSATIRFLLVTALVPRGNGARIGPLVRAGGYSFSFAAPSPGRLVIAWYRLAHGRQTRVAAASFVFHRANTAKIKLGLSGKGRELLSGARRMKLIAKGAFTPVGQHTTSATKRITLNRSPARH